MNKRKIAIFTGSRAEYGLLYPIIKTLHIENRFETYLIISGSHLSSDFGNTISEIDTSIVKKFKKMDIKVPTTNEKAFMLLIFSEIINKGIDILSEFAPNLIVLSGDRYETFAMCVTAFYMNIPIAHIFGGDISQGGHLDDSVRHSITKLAHLHFTTNEDSFKRVIGLGEETWRVFNVGSPVIDNVLFGNYARSDEISKELALDLSKPIIIFTQHPVTTEAELAYGQVRESLEALKELGYQTVITYPCNDTGSRDIIKAINEYCNISCFRIRKSLGWKLYLGCLQVASCVVGNSSSGLMETPIFKIPFINIGTRQNGRLRAENVIDVPYKKNEIKKAINRALKDSNFIEKVKSCSNPYGTRGASNKIVEILKSIPINKGLLQKKMTF